MNPTPTREGLFSGKPSPAALLALSLFCGAVSPARAAAAGEAQSLTFDPARFESATVTVDNATIHFRAYEGIVYVARPIHPEYQCLNFYVPEAYFEGGTVGGFRAETAPIFVPNFVGGYMPAKPGKPQMGRDGRPNSVAVALAKGLVVASPGARGRTLKGPKGEFSGNAPAGIVDLKAAIRYLRHNDRVMPGDAEKIVTNGTSAGGAFSSLLGATGNHPDYEPYLRELGAPDARDDVFAASCYCPIINLEHADAAYEWLFAGIAAYDFRGRTGTMSAEQIEFSRQLKPGFPPYLNGLGLRRPDGVALQLDENGRGTFRDYVRSFVMASATQALRQGVSLSGREWLTVKDGVVTDLDFDRFVVYATRMKTAPAFDSLDLQTPENELFGTATVERQHFTAFGQQHGSPAPLADPAVVRLLNPMEYIGVKSATTARHWRLRHGTKDRDTSLAIPVMLATRLQNSGADVDFFMPWDRGHGGDYDLDELFAWIQRICAP
jgi:hypothetical protein